MLPQRSGTTLPGWKKRTLPLHVKLRDLKSEMNAVSKTRDKSDLGNGSHQAERAPGSSQDEAATSACPRARARSSALYARNSEILSLPHRSVPGLPFVA